MVCDNGAVRSRVCAQPMSGNMTSKSNGNLCDKDSGPTGQDFDRGLDMGTKERLLVSNACMRIMAYRMNAQGIEPEIKLNRAIKH